MAHPFAAHRQHRVEKDRAHKIAGGRLAYASGGAVEKHASAFGEEDSEKTSDGQVAKDKKHLHLTASAHVRRHGGKADGHKAKHRLDRRHRAKGGRAHEDAAEDAAMVRHMVKPSALAHRAKGGRAKGKTNVTVVVNPGGGDRNAVAPAASPMAAIPPAPPMAVPPPPGLPPGLAGAPPGVPPSGLGPRPGMVPPPLRARGGGVRGQGPGDKMPEHPPGWREGEKHKTPVQHTDGKTDGKDIGRGPVITKARGGPILGDSKLTKPLPTPRMEGGIGAGPQKTAPAKPPHMTAGSKSGVGRLQKLRSGSHGAAP